MADAPDELVDEDVDEDIDEGIDEDINTALLKAGTLNAILFAGSSI